MTNKHTHHFTEHVFSQQSHTPIEQNLPTSGLVAATPRTSGGGAAVLPRISPLDAASGISRAYARQTAHQTAEWPIGRPMHKDKNLLPHIRYGTKAGKRPDTGSQIYTSGNPNRGGGDKPLDPDNTWKAFTHAKRPPRGVRQDKDRFASDRAASLQPAAVKEFTRSQATSRKSARSKNIPADNPRCVPVQVWVSPVVKAELLRIASQDGLSLSSAGAALLQRGIQRNVDMQYGALLRPIIETAIAKQMAGIATRLTWLLVRIAFDAGQTRSLVTNILGRQLDKNQPLFKTILKGSDRSAKANIMRRTPQIADLISSVEQWMTEDNRGVSDKKIHD